MSQPLSFLEGLGDTVDPDFLIFIAVFLSFRDMGQDLGTRANINIAGNYGCSFPKYGFHKTHHHIAFATRAISVSLFSDLLES